MPNAPNAENAPHNEQELDSHLDPSTANGETIEEESVSMESVHTETVHTADEDTHVSKSANRLTQYRSHRAFASTIANLQIISIAGAFTIPLMLVIHSIAQAVGLTGDSSLWPTSVLFGGIAFSLAILLRGHAIRTLGIRRRNHLPVSWKKRLRMSSMESQLKILRITLLLFASLPIVAQGAIMLITRNDGDALTVPSSFLFLFGWLAFMLSGFTVFISSVSSLRDFRSRAIRHSLRFHHRGVALRSFIAAFDSPARKIYKSCSLSRRISRMHRTVFITTIACLSMAGCLAVYIRSDHFISLGLTALSILGIALAWPTKHRLVQWSAQLLDPFCVPADEEYEIYS